MKPKYFLMCFSLISFHMFLLRVESSLILSELLGQFIYADLNIFYKDNSFGIKCGPLDKVFSPSCVKKEELNLINVSCNSCLNYQIEDVDKKMARLREAGLF